MDISTLYENSWKTIISPPIIRHQNSALGPIIQTINSCQVIRTDINFVNSRGKTLSGFVSYCQQFKQTDLIVYLHGNGGTKLDALPLINNIPKYKLAIAAMDFIGCGNSQHGYLTYGNRQSDDVKQFIDQIHKIIQIKSLVIWGRSMGAATAIQFASRYGQKLQLNGLVLDAPFQRLDWLVQRTAYSTVDMPKTIIDVFLYFLKMKVNSEVCLDHCLFQLDYLQIMKGLSNKLAILFIYSNFDKLVPSKEILEFYNAFPGHIKQTYQIFEQHNQQRTQSMFCQVIKWLKRSIHTSKPITSKIRKSLVQLTSRNIMRKSSQSTHDDNLTTRSTLQ